MNKLNFLKAIVFIMTFLLIFGIISAGMIIVKKHKTPTTAAEISLNQPAGSHIADYKIDNGKLYIFVKGKKISDRIIVVDSSPQTILATVKNN